MIPILYNQFETEFKSNGIGRLVDCTNCLVTEERNGIFECEFVYPVSGRHYNDIQEGCVILVTHDDTRIPQPFDIYSREAPINGLVTFHAHHISYRLGNVILKPFSAGSCAEAFARMKANSANDNPFEFWTDKEVTANFKVDTPVNVKEILGGVEGSILDVYGKAEYEWDVWTVKLHLNRGTRKDIQIRYGKNLNDITYEKDYSETYSAVAPFWKSQTEDSEEIVTLPEVFVKAENLPVIQSELITATGDLVIAGNGEEIEISSEVFKPATLDLSSSYQERPTEEQLRARALQSLGDSYEPDENITVDFCHLWQTEEYASIAPLQRCSLCDRVDVYYPEIGVIAREQQIISVVYNTLLERYDSMELGKARTSFAETLKAKIEGSVLKQVPSKSYLDEAIDYATDMITGGLGGNVIIGTDADGRPNEILIMDTDDVSTAVNVWRFNSGGLGHSHSGYNGPFDDVALTADGKINANMVTFGTLNGNLLKAGIITDREGRNFWNLETGEISISFDPGSGAAATQADLQRVENNARTWAEDAESNANSYTDSALEDYSDDTELAGKFQVFREGLVSEFSSTYSTKGDTTASEQRYYYQSTSPTQLFGGQWTTTAPTWIEGMYLWEKTRYIKGDGTYTESQAVCTTGNTGAEGTQGADGEDAFFLYITQDKASSVAKEKTSTVVFTAHVQKAETADIDPNGYNLHYAWFQTRDDGAQEMCGGGKTHTVVINGLYCENAATLWFGIVEEDYFNLSDANGNAIVDANGTEVEVA